ncbi:sigma-70 family RNA polymerase sigma factor [Novosphingobium terrae]|uniref:sigma-70 family RNA polymerase sigma factor n=1 Tax=Novosphingobium terrae TaxID=2726189 RepID=UPI001980239E|nr:sigma-70 family RNA polymerase sigma factor [Novosphingobium terrae]
MKFEAHEIRHYASHRASLVDYAAGILGDRTRAEDIVQDAWLVLRRRTSVEPVRDFASYLRRTVHNLAIDSLRRIEREKRVSSGQDLETVALAVADPAPSAETHLIARQELASVLDVLATLPPQQRKAIELYRLQGLKLREIAVELGISISSAHALVIDGLAHCSARRPKGR